jgi:hypothetical protein
MLAMDKSFQREFNVVAIAKTSKELRKALETD